MFINPKEAVGNFSQVVIYANPDAPSGEKVQAVDPDTGELLYKAVPFTKEETDRLKAWTAGETVRNAQAEINRLEGQITIRRIREACADATWMNAQEALIATERAKL